MSVTKTAADVRREEKAAKVNARLVGTGISLVAGGRKGPYTLACQYLNEREAFRAIAALTLALGRMPKPLSKSPPPSA